MVTAVIDTKVLISALVGHGKPKQLVLRLLHEHTVVSSRDMLAELADVLMRAKFAEIESSQINSLLMILARKSILVDIKQPLKVVVEDPDDDVVLATAHEGKARYVISGDKHLLRMRKFRGIEIVSAKRMLEILKDLKE